MRTGYLPSPVFALLTSISINAMAVPIAKSESGNTESAPKAQPDKVVDAPWALNFKSGIYGYLGICSVQYHGSKALNSSTLRFVVGAQMYGAATHRALERWL